LIMEECILVFDIGKTNKKILLFDRELSVLHEEEVMFPEVTDEDGFPREDAERLESWIDDSLERFLTGNEYMVRGVNFTTYGATIAHVDAAGNRVTPLYNYLKPLPGQVLEGFYERYGGEEDFCRRTASPAMGMLNSGIQLLWLKRVRPDLFKRVKHVMHFAQYLSYRLTGRVASEYTSVGCHTAMWDFDRMQYHDWLGDEGMALPDPEPASVTSRVRLHGKQLEVGVGIHDSSSSLVPYLKNSGKSFVLLSTGTWCVIMNPYNQEPLTTDQLRGNCLCYLSTDRKPVKSALFFMGRVHDLNVERLTSFFGEKQGIYRTLQPGPGELRLVWTETRKGRYFFKSGVPDNLVDQQAELSVFGSFRDAYARLLADLTGMVVDALKLVLPGHESPDILYITGGFSKNPYFTGFLALAFPGTRVFTSEVANATSLGAAMVIAPAIWPGGVPRCDLGLKPVRTGISS